VAGSDPIPYAYRDDPGVPDFPDDRPLIVFDNVCVLCSGFVQWVIAHDRRHRFRFTSAQGRIGQGLYRHFGLPTDAFETNLLLVDGTVHRKSGSFLKTVDLIGTPWAWVGVARIIPVPVRDWIYDRIARNRYRLFGRRATCWLPDESISERML
jgi:predicted DCC family thiol-disulfide oxidoreductase YuxK